MQRALAQRPVLRHISPQNLREEKPAIGFRMSWASHGTVSRIIKDNKDLTRSPCIGLWLRLSTTHNLSKSIMLLHSRCWSLRHSEAKMKTVVLPLLFLLVFIFGFLLFSFQQLLKPWTNTVALGKFECVQCGVYAGTLSISIHSSGWGFHGSKTVESYHLYRSSLISTLFNYTWSLSDEQWWTYVFKVKIE